MKKDGIRNVVIGALWIIIGIIALFGNIQLALFHLIPINGIVVIVLGVIWGGVGVYQMIRPSQPAAQPAAGMQQPDPSQPTPV